MSIFKVGNRVRVVRPDFSFNDYLIGDTAVIADVDAVGADVVWDCARFDTHYERSGRCKYLYFDELELIA